MYVCTPAYSLRRDAAEVLESSQSTISSSEAKVWPRRQIHGMEEAHARYQVRLSSHAPQDLD